MYFPGKVDQPSSSWLCSEWFIAHCYAVLVLAIMLNWLEK